MAEDMKDMSEEDLVKDLEKMIEEDRKKTLCANLTLHELNYLIACIDDDDDYAVEYVNDNYEFENWQKDENNIEYKISKKLETICQEWQDNLRSKLQKIADELEKIGEQESTKIDWQFPYDYLNR